ncbi:MAG TPA: hypothetical protein ENN72_09245 [Firmicutes bacterium]|nr:hypothetical protein [Bacillota bacterium]
MVAQAVKTEESLIPGSPLWDCALHGDWEGSPLYFKGGLFPMWFCRINGKTYKWISTGEDFDREAFLMIALNLEQNERVLTYTRRFLPALKKEYVDLRMLRRQFRLDNIYLFAQNVSRKKKIHFSVHSDTVSRNNFSILPLEDSSRLPEFPFLCYEGKKRREGA